MLSYKQFLLETFITSEYQKSKEWLETLNLDIRTPKGMKREHNFLKNMKSIFDTVDTFRKGVPTKTEISSIGRIMTDDFSKEDIEKINSKFGKNEDKSLEIKKGTVTYIKADASAYDKFTKAVLDINKFLSTLSGFHKKAIKNLKIKFVKKSELKSKAKYNTKTDEILINLQSMGKTTNDYGSLVYVILHELGHRYLRVVKSQSWNIDDSEWITTKYSKIDSWSGEEKFSELFALSNWESKYKQYKDKIEKFKLKIK